MPSIYLLETKTKGDIEEAQVRRQLTFDLQTMFYSVALREVKNDRLALALDKGYTIAGVRYNIVRRPLAGGKHSIRQKQNEQAVDFYQRLGSEIAADPEYFFIRLNVTLTEEDVRIFKVQFLNPILEQLCDWWGWITSPAAKKNPFEDHGIHWRTPYGFYNPLAEQGATDLDEYLSSGSTIGLTKGATLFKELE